MCYNCIQITGMTGTVVLDQQVCLLKLHPTSVHVSSTCTRPAAQLSLSQGRQTYLPLHMFDYGTQDQYTCLKPIRFSVTASKDQQACCNTHVFNHVFCSQPAGMFDTVAPDHITRWLQFNSSSCPACTSHQHIC